MKRTAFLPLIITLLLLCSRIATAEGFFYVDINKGSDSASGTQNAPLQTLEGAIMRLPTAQIDRSWTIYLAAGDYIFNGDSNASKHALEMNRSMREGVKVRIVGQGPSTLLNWKLPHGGIPMISVTQGHWSLEKVQVGSRLATQRQGMRVTGPGLLELHDVRIHTASQSDAGLRATRGGTMLLYGKIELNEDLHENAGTGESFCGIVAEYFGTIRFREKKNASLSIGNGSLSAKYYGIIELGCATARITSWHDQANAIAINNSGRIDFHNTKALLSARNPRNTPIGLEDDGHVLAEGAPITIQGFGNGNAIVLQKASAFFCNDVTLAGDFNTPLSVMSGSTLLVGIIGDLNGGEVMTGGRIILEKCTGKLTKPIDARSQGIAILPKGLQTSGAPSSKPGRQVEMATATPAPSSAMTIHQAAQFGHEGKVKDLLDQGADVNQPDTMGRTPLHWATVGGHRRLVEWLLSIGADPNAHDKKGRTPHDLAIKHGHNGLAGFLQELNK